LQKRLRVPAFAGGATEWNRGWTLIRRKVRRPGLAKEKARVTEVPRDLRFGPNGRARATNANAAYISARQSAERAGGADDLDSADAVSSFTGSGPFCGQDGPSCPQDEPLSAQDGW